MKWKRIIGWTVAVLVGLLAITAFVGYTVLKSEGFHRYVLAKIVQNANEATGARTEARAVDFHWSTLTADLYGLTMHGTEPVGAKPLLQVDKVTVGLKILSLWRHSVNLSRLEIEHPVVHLLVSRDGLTNVPHPQATTNKSASANVFQLAVGHTRVNNGEIYYNDKKDSLNADLHDLRTEIDFSFLATRYSGSLGYQNGHVQFADLAPLSHGLNLQFSADPSGMTFAPLVLTLGSSRLSMQANLTDYANPAVKGSYAILIHTQDFAGMAKEAAPTGDVTSSGTLRYQSMPGRPMFRTVFAEGEVDGKGLTLTSSQGRIDVSKLQGRYRLANGDLQVHNILADLLRGELRADLDMQRLEVRPVAKLHVSVRGISIASLRDALRAPGFKSAPLVGDVEGTADASWAGAMQDLRARADIGVQGAIASPSTQAVPLKAAIHADYDGPSGTISVRRSILQTPATSLTAQGQVSRHSNLSIQGRTTDLHELVLLMPALQRANVPAQSPAANARPMNISGAGTVDAVMQGSMDSPRLSARVAGQNLELYGSRWSNLRVQVQASSSEIALQNGTLASASQGQVQFGAKVGLHEWSYSPGNPLTANASIRQLPVAELEKLAGTNIPIVGDLSGDVALQGSQLNPVGHGSLQLVKARAYDEPIQTVSVQFQAAGGTINSTLDVKLPAGALSAKFSYIPKTRSYEAHLKVPSLQLEKLQTVAARNIPLNGTISASADGSGTLDNPQLTATLRLPQFQIQQTMITGIKADVSVANQHANLVLTSTVVQATVQARASVNLSGDYYTEATIDTTKVSLDPLLAVYVVSLPNGFQGETELHATLKGPLKDRARMEAHVVVPTLTASYQSLQIANAGPIRMDYANSVVTVRPSELKGTETSVRLQGRIPLGSTEPTTLTAQGSVDMRLLEIFSPGVQSGGTVTLDLRTAGNLRRPEVQGQIRLQDVALIATAAPLGLEHMNGTLDLGNDQLHISQLTAQVGGGQLSAGGSITYQPKMQFNVALDAKSVRLRYPDGVRTVFDGNIALTGNLQEAAMTGRVLIDGLSFTSDFDLATLMNQFTGTSAPPIGQSFADRVKLNLNVQSAEDLSAASSQLSIEGQVNLRVIGTAAEPVLVGRADLTSGDIFFLKQRYQLERGVINFTSPNRTRPVVNILMTTTINQYNLSLTVTGPIEKLTTSYVSDPPLPPVDIINLIARGQTTEESTPSTMGANTILAQGLASQVSSSVEKLAGISSLQIDPLLGGNDRNPSARVAVQKRVTKNFIFTFSTDVTDPQSEIIQGEYQINRRWSVSVARDEGGGVAVDGRFHTTF